MTQPGLHAMKHQACPLGPAPTLVAYRDQPEIAAAQGTVLLFHGFSVDALANIRELESLAEQGFLAVGVDNAGHGRRRDPHWDQKFNAGDDHWRRHFFDLVDQSVAEVPLILNALQARGWLPSGNAGAVGISMGGLIVYEAIVHEPRIVSATPIIATPVRIADQASKFYPAAILSQTAGRDAVVPWQEAAAFHQSLEPFYVDQPSRQKWINYPDSPHTLREQDWHQIWANVLAWHKQYLT